MVFNPIYCQVSLSQIIKKNILNSFSHLSYLNPRFPLYMVFRILDLFLYEGFLAIFSIAISLLKASQRDLLALDFEGVLKYFRVSMPKKYRLEQTFNNQLMQIWVNIHSKMTEKKLKKYEKNYRQMKEAEELKENPLIRYERECKRLNTIVRRLEQENDDLANEYIESKINLSKQLEEHKDDYELVKNELFKYKTDYQNKLNETNDTNKKLTSELDQVKQLWRKQSEKYENELERNNIIIGEYKNICNTLSNKEKKKSTSSSQKRFDEEKVSFNEKKKFRH
jgi:Rab GTPase-activating protein 1